MLLFDNVTEFYPDTTINRSCNLFSIFVRIISRITQKRTGKLLLKPSEMTGYDHRKNPIYFIIYLSIYLFRRSGVGVGADKDHILDQDVLY